MRKPKCKPNQHLDRPRRRGRVKCERCNDVFPCKKQPCAHVDCAAHTGDYSGLPSWVVVREDS